jgi:predicted DNA-binding transcriptional regulator YafY
VRGGLGLLRKVLAILPVVQANQGIRVKDLSRLTGIPASEIVTDLPRLVNLCGVPPYSPMDLVDLHVEGDRVSIRFANQFRRPVRLTLAEALALDLALAGLDREEDEKLASAVRGIREKVRAALTPEVAEGLEQTTDRISSVPGPGRAGRTVARLKEALSRQVEVRIEYFSRGSGRLGTRVVCPYGVYEQAGHFYIVAWDHESEDLRTFRADRIRSAELTETEYEIPDEFEVGSFRRTGPPEPAGPAISATIRFRPDEASRFAREDFPAQETRDEPDGSMVATIRTSSLAWLTAELLMWGGWAEVEGPKELRNELRDRARATLALYRKDGPSKRRRK